MDSNIKMLLVVVISMVLGGIIFLGINYILIDNLLGSKLQQPAETEEAEAEPDEEEQVEKGIIVDLGDFVLNLADTDQKRYLKANVALELSKLPTDPDLSAPQAGGEGGGHGHGEAAPVDPIKQLEMEMAQY